MKAARKVARVITLRPRQSFGSGPLLDHAGLADLLGRHARPVYGKLHPVNLVYHLGRVNTCPHCYGIAWNVGRTTAECAGCELPMSLVRSTP